MTQRKWILYAGDVLSIAVLTLIGFATHGETDVAFLPRMGALFVPMILSWFLIAPGFGLFQRETTSTPTQLWRPVLAMLFAVPLAAVLRGFILNAPVLPIFAAILAGTSALGILIWRGLYFLWNRRAS
ncbi:MAG TPA: DUF3054 domain-containing protein [Anaerolineales bacterium]|nr:DUF3054 domain-containing protein [Anaerolineales bacterium]